MLVSLLLISSVAGSFALSASKSRGLHRDSVWLLQASEQREDFYRAWFGRPNPQTHVVEKVKDKAFINKNFKAHGALPALMPASVATLKGAFDVEAPRLKVIRVLNALFFASFIFLVGLMGLEVGGGVGALFAALGAASIPRLFGLATVPDFAMSTLLFMTLAPYLLHRARRSALASCGATFAVAAALHTGIIGLFVGLPWLFLVLSRARRVDWGDGFAATPPVPLRNLFVLPVGLAIGFLAYPMIWVDLKDSLNVWLTHFLRIPTEPFSYAGVLWGEHRIPWHAAPYLLMVTTPPVYVLMALAGCRGGPRYRRWMTSARGRFLKHLPFAPGKLPDAADRHGPSSPEVAARAELLRFAKGMLLFTLLLPMIMRGPIFSGADLLALALPWGLVYVAAGAARILPALAQLFPLRWQRYQWGIVGVFVLLLITPPVIEIARFHPLEEAYYSWIVGGPQGARRHGLPRYPRGPMPRALLEHINEATGNKKQSRVKLLISGRDYHHALHLGVTEGAYPKTSRLETSLKRADAIVLPYDDLSKDYEGALTDFFRTFHLRSDLEMITFERDAVPIFSVLIKR